MKTVIVFSGGLDSTVLLYHLKDLGHELRAFSVDYGQRHRRELDCASAICANLGLPHTVADLSTLGQLLGGNSLTNPEIPVAEGHYTAEGMKTTVVPNRNMILLALAAGHALASEANSVAYAAHSGDHAIYPDCRREFADKMAEAMALADWDKVELLRPFVDWSKEDIVRRGANLHVPFEMTWSCYKGLEKHCGRCGTCIERREAFDLSGVPDPTAYGPDAADLERLKANNWRLER